MHRWFACPMSTSNRFEATATFVNSVPLTKPCHDVFAQRLIEYPGRALAQGNRDEHWQSKPSRRQQFTKDESIDTTSHLRFFYALQSEINTVTTGHGPRQIRLLLTRIDTC